MTYLTLNAPGASVSYDLGVGTDNVITLTSFGSSLPHPAITAALRDPPDPFDLVFPALLIAGTLIIVIPFSVWQLRPRRASRRVRDL